MKSLVQTAVLALATATGVSGNLPQTTVNPDHAKEEAATAQLRGATGLSFEDLRVGPTGKAAVKIGPIDGPIRLAKCKDDNCSGC